MSICRVSVLGTVFGRPRQRNLVLDIRAHRYCSLDRGRVLRLLAVKTSPSMHRIAWTAAGLTGGDRFRLTTDSVGAVQNGALFGCGQH